MAEGERITVLGRIQVVGSRQQHPPSWQELLWEHFPRKFSCSHPSHWMATTSTGVMGSGPLRIYAQVLCFRMRKSCWDEEIQLQLYLGPVIVAFAKRSNYWILVWSEHRSEIEERCILFSWCCAFPHHESNTERTRLTARSLVAHAIILLCARPGLRATEQRPRRPGHCVWQLTGSGQNQIVIDAIIISLSTSLYVIGPPKSPPFVRSLAHGMESLPILRLLK